MNTLVQKSNIKHPLSHSVTTTNCVMLTVKQNASIVKKIAIHCLKMIKNFCLYFPVTFVWFTVAFALSGHFSMSYPFEPDAMYLTFDKVIDLLTPVFRLSVAITLIICLLRQTVVIYQKKFNRKESTSC